MSPLLEMKNISKTFPGVKALENVDFSLTPGEVHCLIGANGAGKSTLMKILAGVQSMDTGGEIILNEKPVNIQNPMDSKSLGISTIYQELSLIEGLTVGENIFVGNYLNAKNGIVKWKKINEKAQEILNFLDVDVPTDTIISELSMGKKQMVEIAKAIALEAKIIVMDEPSTALSEDEVQKLFRVIRELKRQGITIIYISHKLEELFTIGDRVTVLRNGKWIITEQIDQLTQDELIKHITGREIIKKENTVETSSNEEFLKVTSFQNFKLKNVNFALGKGEILGLYGLVGSGRTELLRAIYGADSLEEGKLYLEGNAQKINSPQKAVELGIGLVPENRKTEGSILDLSISENAILPSLSKYSTFSFLKGKKIKQAIGESIKKLNVKTHSEDVHMRNLSGGNQQKVIISKWLIHQSKLLLFDEPTQGIDVGAKAEIYDIMKELAEQGTSIIVTSSELEELLSVCNRVLVMYDGKIIKEFTTPAQYRSEILHTAVSGK